MAIRKLMDELEEEMDDISKEQVSHWLLLHNWAIFNTFNFLENADRHR